MINKVLLYLILLVLFACSSAYKLPQPIGGIEAIEEKLYYTDDARLHKIEGKMLVRFIVKPDSSISNIQVITPLGYGLDEIAVTAVKNTKFEPGKMDGKIVEVEVTMPIFFIYNNPK